MSQSQDLQRPGAVVTRYSANPRESIIFYTSRHPQILELDRSTDPLPQRSDGGAGAQPAPEEPRCHPAPPPPPSVQPFIATPGQLAAMRYHSLNCVYGLRIDHYITQLSPANFAYEAARTCQGFSALAACGDGERAGWLYYASNVNHDPNRPAILTQFDLTQQVPNSSIPAQNIIDPTYLSAIFIQDVAQRWIIYQVPDPEDPALRILQLQRNNQAVINGPIMATDNAIPQTPHTIVANEKYVFLYYISRVGNNTRLRRVQRNRDATGDPDQWKPANVSESPVQFNLHLQITATIMSNGFARIFQENPRYTGAPGQNRFFFLDDTVPN